MLVAGEELTRKLAAAVTEKEELKEQIGTMEEQLAVTRQSLASVEIQHDEQFSALKRDYEQRLTEVEMQHERRLAEVEVRHEVEVKTVRDQLGDDASRLRQEMSSQLDRLKAKNSALEQELNALRESPNANSDVHGAELTRLEAEKSQLETRLKAAEDRLRKLDAETSTVVRVEKERRDGLERKVAGLEAKLAEANKKCRDLVAKERDSIQREHDHVVASLREKLAEKNRQDRVKLATVSQVFLSEMVGVFYDIINSLCIAEVFVFVTTHSVYGLVVVIKMIQFCYSLRQYMYGMVHVP